MPYGAVGILEFRSTGSGNSMFLAVQAGPRCPSYDSTEQLPAFQCGHILIRAGRGEGQEGGSV